MGNLLLRMMRLLACGAFALCAGAHAAAFSLVDGAGRSVAFEAPAARVIPVAPSTTEIVSALGAADRMIARTRYAHYPRFVEALPDIGGAYDPDYERVLALKPDLVIVSNHADKRTAQRFEALGLRVLILHKEGLLNVLDDIALVGAALGEEQAARREVGRIRGALERRAEQLGKIAVRRPRALLVFDTRAAFLCAGKGSFAGDLLERAGAENPAAAAGVPWPQLGREAVLRADPDIVLQVVEDFEDCPPQVDAALLEHWREDPVWKRLKAVRAGRVYRLDAGLFNYPGPRLDTALEQLSAIVDAYFAEEARSGNSSDATSAQSSSAPTTASDHSTAM